MIKVKITKNVINKSVSPLGSAMTPRLIVCTVLGLAAAKKASSSNCRI